jgi:zinc and cadmium transporter
VNELTWIILSGLLMSSIALIGSVTLLIEQSNLEKLLLPLVAFAAGSLVGGAFFHMIPAAHQANLELLTIGIIIVAGFTAFFVLEQFLHWHHSHTLPNTQKEPFSYLILIGDALHNLLGGMAIGGTFLIDIRLGIASWLAAAAHEVPQELGDFAVLISSGWSKRQALLFNFLSGLTFLLGGLIAFLVSKQFNVAWLIPFAAGNFIYIGASDLIPQVNQKTKPHPDIKNRLLVLISFLFGLLLLLLGAL